MPEIEFAAVLDSGDVDSNVNNITQAAFQEGVDSNVNNITQAAFQEGVDSNDINDNVYKLLLTPLVLVTVNDFGTAINRTEIETALTENGVTIPLIRDTVFNICDSSETMWQITYRQSLDNFYESKLGTL